MDGESLNAPFGARCFLTELSLTSPTIYGICLNAPFGARCFLNIDEGAWRYINTHCLNAPFGARCFLTNALWDQLDSLVRGLNVPFGAPCFLKGFRLVPCSQGSDVLMHLLALGAFWWARTRATSPRPCQTCLNAPFGARCFLTPYGHRHVDQPGGVLMHRLALGAF